MKNNNTALQRPAAWMHDARRKKTEQFWEESIFLPSFFEKYIIKCTVCRWVIIMFMGSHNHRSKTRKTPNFSIRLVKKSTVYKRSFIIGQAVKINWFWHKVGHEVGRSVVRLDIGIPNVNNIRENWIPSLIVVAGWSGLAVFFFHALIVWRYDVTSSAC